ncbi:P-loop containing nucleoside triphosphate hydrolases superfamily protein [Rhynchospora pubera]|uniref:P-loop containing nucleoside triphosphate hydrolases superfamily protein n=1 Tax=Rhynchospora pubera TaxID=906938 RepID=A0AAV8HSL6_9POAL|nr:P-loop containing nucleoside triphosphate hydrolases superfamily protein [Rhynchospora pubera]
MPVGVRLRTVKKTVSMTKKGKKAGIDSENTKKTKNKESMEFKKTKLRKTKRDKKETLSSIAHGKEEKVRYRLSQASESVPSVKEFSSERKFRRIPTESKALTFEERLLRTVKIKHNREYGEGKKHQGNKEKVDLEYQFLKRDNNSKKEISKGKADLKDKILEEDEDKENQGHISKPKLQRSSRVLDKTGKKIRVNWKKLGSRSEEKSELKRKRLIKIDPYDNSNKRLDDTPLSDENVEEKVVEMSKNAQFRAIQPSSSILSFVDDNLLGRRRLNELTNAGYNVKLSAPLDNMPFSKSTERDRIEPAVFRNKLEFFAAAKVPSSFPPPVLPEIAFAGRSNVGKSSLLNALTRQWGVARTSDKPGLTQTINFFRLASKLCLVDLPGYGFAYAKEEVKDAWEELVKEYVSTRVGLQRVCLLVDTKWGMKPRDYELVDLMERSQTPYQIVLTKTDIVFPIDLARRAMQIQESLKEHKSVINPVTMVSSKTGGGIRHLRTVLSKFARFVKP